MSRCGRLRSTDYGLYNEPTYKDKEAAYQKQTPFTIANRTQNKTIIINKKIKLL
jgi:hypothetical protein